MKPWEAVGGHGWKYRAKFKDQVKGSDEGWKGGGGSTGERGPASANEGLGCQRQSQF